MKPITQLILILLLTFTFVPVYGEDEDGIYYCADNEKAGFNFNKTTGSYQMERDGIVTSKFKIKLDRAKKRIEMAHDLLGKLQFTCTQPYSSSSALNCIYLFSMFNFNPDNGRYVLAHGHGYVIDDVSSVVVAIGKCDKF